MQIFDKNEFSNELGPNPKAVIDVLPEVLTERRIHDENITKEQLQSGEFFGEMFLPILKAWRDYKRRPTGG